MFRNVFYLVFASLLFSLAACQSNSPSSEPAATAAPEHKFTIFMAGDSTMSIKQLKDYPETGWGVPFAVFFDDSVRVENRAMNGRSTKTFISEGRWQGIMDELQAGDFVFIQFGHNDESIKKQERYTTPEQFKNNLLRFIADVTSKGAEPILLSPITRRYFDDNGKIKLTHSHSPMVVEVAEQTNVAFIDMDPITRDYFTEMGDDLSTLRFMHIKPNTHPNYPFGVKDNTHTNHLGAREVAQLVLAELRKMEHPLVEHLRPTDPKHLKLKY
ncbi:Lysophospholipase L1 [Alteromonadaceae bacterium Bs31]|nr:Lysophospholipase L1 [Alteromonadaceae bacterium Bs31]